MPKKIKKKIKFRLGGTRKYQLGGEDPKYTSDPTLGKGDKVVTSSYVERTPGSQFDGMSEIPSLDFWGSSGTPRPGGLVSGRGDSYMTKMPTRGYSSPTTEGMTPRGIEDKYISDPSLGSSAVPKSHDEAFQMFQEGLISEEDWKMYEQMSESEMMGGMEKEDAFNQRDENGRPWYENMPLVNPGGSSLDSKLFMTGRAFGAKPGTRGKGLGMVAGTGASILHAARQLGSGIAHSRKTQRNMDEYNTRQQEESRRYTDVDTTRNRNYTSGMMKFGGEYEEGGEQDIFAGQPDFEEGLYQDQQQQQETPQVSEEEVFAMAQELLSNLQSPEEIDKYLKDQGVDEQMYEMIMQAVMMIIEESKQQQEEESGGPVPSSMMRNDSVEGPAMESGISFKQGGEMVNSFTGSKISLDSPEGRKAALLKEAISNGTLNVQDTMSYADVIGVDTEKLF